MIPPKDRKAAERQRRKDAGLVRLELWVKPEHHAAIKAFSQIVDIRQTELEIVRRITGIDRATP